MTLVCSGTRGVKRERGGGGKRADEESMECRVWSMAVEQRADDRWRMAEWRAGLRTEWRAEWIKRGDRKDAAGRRMAAVG
jgi:hypothetical protein